MTSKAHFRHPSPSFFSSKLLKTAQVLTWNVLVFRRNNRSSTFLKKTLVIIKKISSWRTADIQVHGTKWVELKFFSVLAQTFRFSSRKQSNLLPVSAHKFTANSFRSDNHCTVFACNFDVLSRWIWKVKGRCHMKDPVNRGEKLIDKVGCQTDRWSKYKEALTSNAHFWNPVQFCPQVKQVTLVWIFTYIFKVCPNDFHSYCKDLTEKVIVSFKVHLIDVACFYSEVHEIFR